MASIAVKVELTDEERKEFENLGRNRKMAQALARHARIVLAAAEGLTNMEAKLKMTAATVGKVAPSLCEALSRRLRDEPRPGESAGGCTGADIAPD